MREKIIAGNWKMNKDLGTAITLAEDIIAGIDTSIHSKVILAAPFPFLGELKKLLNGHENIILAAQNIYPRDEGAFTGEVSAPMLLSCNVEYVIVGHSERRQYFGEENAFISKKLNYAISRGIRPILCVGESLEVRDKKEHEKFVLDQLKECIQGVTPSTVSELIIAYEPIWAIGTGRTASPEQAQEMHSAIRSFMKKEFPENGAEVPVLYGGSMKPKNAESLLECDDIDGGLIGGASLQSDSFLEIIKTAERIT